MSLGFNLAARAMETPPSPSLSTTAAIPFSGGSPFSVIDQTHSEFATGTFTGALLVTHTSIPNPAPPPASRVGIGLCYSDLEIQSRYLVILDFAINPI